MEIEEVVASLYKNKNLLLLKYGIDWKEDQIAHDTQRPDETFYIKLGNNIQINDQRVISGFSIFNIHVWISDMTPIQKGAIYRTTKTHYSTGKIINYDNFLEDIIRIVIRDKNVFDEIFSTLLYAL